MNPFLSRSLSRSLIDRKDGHRSKVLACFEDACRMGCADRAVLDRRTGEELAALLDHARRTVPIFREVMGEGDAINAANARALLPRLPIMRRSDIQSRPEQFLSSDAGICGDDATGGSTGTPMSFKVDASTQRAREASLMWANHLAGWQPGEKIAMLWGSTRDVQNARARMRLSIRWWIESMRWYNAFDMGEDRMAEFHRDLSCFRPHLLVAYAGSVFVFARYLKARGIVPEYPSRAIVSSAEMMTPSMRRLVEEVLGKPVFDRYGNREFGAIAAECGAHGGLHINESDCIVEIDSDDPFKKEGRILVTYLRNYAMPFIRYDTGDMGRFETVGPCACGRTTLRLAPVAGRMSDTIRTRSGKLIHGEFFTHLFYGAAGVKQFQFVQESEDLYVLRVVAEDDVIRAQQGIWRERISRAVGDGLEIRVERVEVIPPSSSGKRRFTLSLLPTQPNSSDRNTPTARTVLS